MPIIPELFSIPGYTYYSQNYSGIISACLAMLLLQCTQRTHLREGQVLFAEEVLYFKLPLELHFRFRVKRSQHPRDWCVLNYVGALALLEKYHRPFVHVGGRAFLEGGGEEVRGANDISLAEVPGAAQFVVKAETNRTF